MDILAILDALQKGEIEPVYFVHGPERFLIDKLLFALKTTVVEGPMADFNLSRLKAGEAGGAAIAAEARAMPMMSKRRLVIVDDAQKLKAADMEALEPYLEKPAPEACLVLVGDKFDLRKGAFSRANRRKQVHKAEPPSERQVIPFISRQAKEKGVKLSREAAGAISAAVGPDYAALDDAVERVGLFAGPGEEVTEEDVSKVVSSVRQHSVFELVDAMGARDRARAMALVEELLARREEPLRLSALISRHFRQLIKARVLGFNGASDKEAASSLGVPPFVAKKLLGQARRFNGSQLEGALGRLARADLTLKSSRRPAGLIFEETVLDLLGA